MQHEDKIIMEQLRLVIEGFVGKGT